jgi:aldose 1-epimerase
LTDRIRIETGRLALEVAPEVGGSIARFERRSGGGWQTIFRKTKDDYADALDAALFPLIPFANRIRCGSFVCDGRAIVLPANMPGDKSPIHGQGWQNPWVVSRQETASVTLDYRHEADAWPWTYDAQLIYEIDETRLRVILTCANQSAEPMPCGLGLHPYYDCDASTLLSTIVSGTWTVDADVLPVDPVPAKGRYSLDGGPICGRSLDNGYDGWGGEATMTWPDRDLQVRMVCADADRFQLFSPPTGGVFVAEPVQNANCALNAPQDEWRALGISTLKTGEAVTLDATFEVFSDSSLRSPAR